MLLVWFSMAYYWLLTVVPSVLLEILNDLTFIQALNSFIIKIVVQISFGVYWSNPITSSMVALIGLKGIAKIKFSRNLLVSICYFCGTIQYGTALAIPVQFDLLSLTQVAREAVLKFKPRINITAYHANVKDPQFNVEFFKQFNVVLNGLDNLDARRHVNRLRLAAGVPLVESGTTGFLGQVNLFLPFY